MIGRYMCLGISTAVNGLGYSFCDSLDPHPPPPSAHQYPKGVPPSKITVPELILSIGVVKWFITGVDVVRNAYASLRRVGGGSVSGLAYPSPSTTYVSSRIIC